MAKTDYTTWVDYYVHQYDTDLPLDSVFNELVTGYLNNEERYLNSVLERANDNFILVPTEDKGHITYLHHCSVYEDDITGSQLIAGVNGSRFTSPWKAHTRGQRK